MRLDKSRAGCTCPALPAEAVATNCPAHFGDGWGYCIPHAKFSDEMVAAVGLKDGVPVCESCRDEGEIGLRLPTKEPS